jgi:hypothetical protein
MIELKRIKINTENPRKTQKNDFNRILKSLKDFPEGLRANPIKVDENYVILAGNQRAKALSILGYKEIPDEWVEIKEGWTKEEKKKFIIKDNQNAGEFDREKIEMNFNPDEIKDFGIEFPDIEIDYSILDEDSSIEEQMEEDKKNVMKSIHIEVEEEDYEFIYNGMNTIRDKGLDVGKEFVKFLNKKYENN